MGMMWWRGRTRPPTVSFYHDIEQDCGGVADVARCRCIVGEFLRLEKQYGVAATYNVVGRLFREQPDLIEMIRAGGQEVAFHSYHHQPDWRPAYYAEEVRLCREASPLPRGYRSPRSEWDRETIRACWRQGLSWSAEADPAGEPYLIYRGLVRLPIAGDDWSLHTGKRSPRQWVEYFSDMLLRRRYVAFGSHDCVASFAPQERLGAWEELLKRAVAAGAELVSLSAAADACRLARRV